MDLEEENGVYTATVVGGDDYMVEIVFHNGNIIGMDCDCPYAMDGHNCKHMAAVLFAIEDDPALAAVAQSDSGDTLYETIQRLPEQTVRDLLLELCRKDDTLRDRILISCAETITQSQFRHMYDRLEEIIYRNSDRSGFVSWDLAVDFDCAVSVFLKENVDFLIAHGLTAQAFQLTNDTLYRIGTVCIDDSFGTTTSIAKTGYDCWEHILAACDLAGRRKMFDWFESCLTDPEVPEYLNDELHNFYVNAFCDREFLIRKLEHFPEPDILIPEYDDYRAYRQQADAITQRFSLMLQLGFSKPELEQYIEKYFHLPTIREMASDNAIQNGDTARAISILEQSKVLDHRHPDLVAKHSRALIELHRKLGQTQALKKELEYQIFSCFQRDLVFTSELKLLSSESEWSYYREQILSVSTCSGIRFHFLEAEGMLERLLQEVGAANSFYLLDRFEKTLKKKFPEEIRDLYAQKIEREASAASNRKEYYSLIQYLKKLRKYPGGHGLATQIAAKWRKEFPRRSAMMDELKKAGF